MLKISGVITPDQFLFYTTRKGSSISASLFRFDGQIPESTYERDWFSLKKAPEKVTQAISHPPTNRRYVLIDPEMKSKKIPLVIPFDEVEIDRVEEWGSWLGPHTALQKLYVLKEDYQAPTREGVEFEVDVICELTSLINSEDNLIHGTNPGHQLIDKILFPTIALQTKPSRLTPSQLYDIIRGHIQTNIDPKYAKITSDYDFCFVVEKRIELTETEEFFVHTNLFSKKKSKKVKRYRDERNLKIFEMAPKPYQEYTVIQSIKAKSHKELKEKVDVLLSNIMEMINEPIKDCVHCKGRGVEQVSKAHATIASE